MLVSLHKAGFCSDLKNINFKDCKPDARKEFSQCAERGLARWIGECLNRGINPVSGQAIPLHTPTQEETIEAVSKGAFIEIQREAALCRQVPSFVKLFFGKPNHFNKQKNYFVNNDKLT